MGGSNQKQKRNEVKLAPNAQSQEKGGTDMENDKVKDGDTSVEGEDQTKLLLNKMILLETRIDEMEKGERNLREKQNKAAKVTTQVEQEVRTMKEALRMSFKEKAPKVSTFPKSNKAMRETMKGQQEEMAEELLRVVERCASLERNLLIVKQEQDGLKETFFNKISEMQKDLLAMVEHCLDFEKVLSETKQENQEMQSRIKELEEEKERRTLSSRGCLNRSHNLQQMIYQKLSSIFDV